MASLADMRTKLAEDVQPANMEAQLSSNQLDRAINLALIKFDATLSVSDLDPQQELTVLVGAMARCYWLLASKFAEGMMIQIENDEFYGQQPYEHYIGLAREYGTLFEDACGGATIEVSTLRRRSLTTGRIIPLPPGEFQ